ncbi:ATP cone domain-containing protein [Clostridium hydrogeniformans]|uniref:ATP cone domain-containing protein n=1 Tax=Clostridium hydrogeniformans TaxID=349933 RepID=UPI000487470E|nr:ATP cone domain-containing protein [Clostridium hydrogeniformans]
MKIIKRSGKLEDFNINKIRVSIENASADARCPLNESDAKVISSEIAKSIEKIRTEKTSSHEVFGATIRTLSSMGFSKIALEYVKYSFV